MSITFVWDDKYSLGDEDIDSQHKYLFELGNTLPEISSEQDIKPVVMKLYKYAREHFTFEEELMKACNFPLYAKHKELHEEVITKLNDITYRKFESETDIVDFKLFLYNWLLDHVLNEDMKYRRFLKNRDSSDKVIK